MAGHLLTRGFHVQQSRIREAQQRVDPESVAIHCLTITMRRHYIVPAPYTTLMESQTHKYCVCNL